MLPEVKGNLYMNGDVVGPRGPRVGPSWMPI